jgi:hypothetical protein
MNLFRSEEHVKSWSQYDPVSAEAIIPVATWAMAFSGPFFRKRLEPDYLSRAEEYMGELIAFLQQAGLTSSFWMPG